MCLASLSRRSSVAGAEELYVSAKLVSVGGVGEQVEGNSASGVEEYKWSGRRVQGRRRGSAELVASHCLPSTTHLSLLKHNT